VTGKNINVFERRVNVTNNSGGPGKAHGISKEGIYRKIVTETL